MNKQKNSTQKVNKIFNRLKEALSLKNDSELATVLQVAPNTFGNWKTRGTADYEKVFTLCEENGLDIDYIITGKKKSTQLVKDEQPEYKLPKFVAPRVVTVDQTGKDNIVLVQEKAAAGYLNGYGDPEFLQSLPSFHLPTLVNGTFRMFQVSGHSMYPTLHNGSFVVGEWVENWAGAVKDDRVYILVTENEGITVKRVLNRLDKYGSLYCKSDNRREYPNFALAPKEILEVWEVKMHLSFELPNPAQLYDRVNDLEAKLMDLETRLGKK